MSPKQTSRTPGFYPAGLSKSTCVPVGARPARLRSTATSARHPRRVCSTCPQEDRSLRQGRRRAATTPRTTMVGYDAGALLLLQQQLDALRAQLSEALAGQGRLVGQQLALLTGQMNDRLREGLELVQRSQAAVGERLDNTSRVVGEVQKGLGELREAASKVYEVGRDVASLHDILRAPKLRGGLGEFLLGDLLAQVLPPAHFTLQHAFRSGERVDAVVRLGDGLVPVDAKFPLEDFRRLLEAADDDERARARQAFVARVRRDIDDIATT